MRYAIALLLCISLMACVDVQQKADRYADSTKCFVVVDAPAWPEKLLNAMHERGFKYVDSVNDNMIFVRRICE